MNKETLKWVSVWLLGVWNMVWPLMFLMGNPWGALPACIGAYCFAIATGELLEPVVQRLFKDE